MQKKPADVNGFPSKTLNVLAEPCQQIDDLAQDGVRGRLDVVAKGGAAADLAQGRIGRNPLRHGLDIQALREGQGPHLDELAGLGADDARAQDAPFAVGDDLDVAAGDVLRLGAVVLVVGPTQDVDRRMRFSVACCSVRPTWASSGSVKVTRAG